MTKLFGTVLFGQILTKSQGFVDFMTFVVVVWLVLFHILASIAASNNKRR